MAAATNRDDPHRRARRALHRHLAGDREAIAAAMLTYDGRYASLGAYVRREIEEHLPDYLAWIPDYLDLDAVARDWVAQGRNWALPDRKTGGVHVFLARDPRAGR
ncbi:MAG: hypothetical protein KC636_25520 [Myxococcales bacterium]|nr:hypothetical protein [Myxococcales bacterium]